MSDRLAQHYIQEAHNCGGGYLMAMNMMAEDLRRAWEGRPPHYPERTPTQSGTSVENISLDAIVRMSGKPE